MGGVPYYLNYIQKGKSAEQNIQEICFTKNGILFTEFERLFQSLFDAPELNIRIIREIARKREGISREELLFRMKMSSGGSFNKRIQEIQAAGFIQGFIPYQFKKKEQHFRVIDEYSCFYLHWIDPVASKGFHQPNYWQHCLRNSSWNTWAGYTFENICLKHTSKILHALELDSTPCEVGNWRYVSSKKRDTGTQIDLLLDRQDGVITLCEIKYSKNLFTIDKAYAQELHRKIEIFREKTKTKKELFLAFITTMGIKNNFWSADLVAQEVLLKDLF